MLENEILFESPKLARVLKITRGKKQLSTPTYFPAISAAKLDLPIDHLIDLLVASSYPRILVSVYDISAREPRHRNKMISRIADYSKRGSFVFLDSGIFESFWRRDDKWDYDAYSKWVPKIESDFYFSFDIIPSVDTTRRAFVSSTVRRVHDSSSISKKSECVAILHGIGSEQLITVVKEFLNSYPQLCGMVAVTEKDCGKSLSKRAGTIVELRRIINSYNPKIALHVLGCGHPISIAVYTYCGADTFDSLDWARFAVERNELKIGDISHLELFKCKCQICSKNFDDPIRKVLLHNLLFYQDFMLKVQAMIKRNTLRDFVLQYVGPEFMAKLS